MFLRMSSYVVMRLRPRAEWPVTYRPIALRASRVFFYVLSMGHQSGSGLLAVGLQPPQRWQYLAAVEVNEAALVPLG